MKIINNRRGIILAGGYGSRLYPTTFVVSKQLLPIFNKPMIYYALSVLMFCGIRDILIITTPRDLNAFKLLLGDGSNFGLKIQYTKQKKPEGLAQAFLLAEDFIEDKSCTLILGDNFFYGQNLTSKLINCTKLKNGAKVILHKVIKPELFGVAKISKTGKIISLKEKPKKYISDLAVTGLYFFDKNVVEYSKKLKPSTRNELEITDLLKIYLNKKKLTSDILGRGGAWLDTGSIDDFYKTSAFVSAIENRQGFKIACLEEIAFNNKWIGKKEILNAIQFYGKCDYSNYLKKLIS